MNTWGNKIRLSIFGESHGEAIGITIDGLPAGTSLDFEKIDNFIERRKSGKSSFTTPRKEKDKYKIFRKNNIQKEMIFLNSEGKIEKKNVTYLEFLDCKYRKKYRINKQNPFEIIPKDISSYEEKIPNSFKYHRILGENINYLFVNINYDKELKIRSLLFKNYESFIKIMLLLDGVINSGNKILNFENKDNEDEIKLKNYISDENRFDLYINDRYIETMHYNITLNEGTKKLETVDQRLRKILS